MTPYLVVAAAATLVAYLLTPGARVIAIKVGAVDAPKDRKVHHAPTPTLGGISLYIAFLAGLAAAAAFPALRDAFRFSEVLGLVIGGAVALALGIADDRRELGASAKLAGQVLAGGILYLSGVQLAFFWLPVIGVISLSPDVSAILTIFWIVLLMNAVNFIDGLDGLAAGLALIAAGALFVYSTRLPEEFLGPAPLAPLVAAALVGACLGFLRHNFNPARIFTGDSGALFLGFVLAGVTISLVGRFSGPVAAGGRLALPLVFTPIVFLALPITDVVFAVVRRVATGRPMFTADKEHIHHRLLRLGHSQRQAVLLMYGWALLLAGGLIVAGTIPWGRFLLAFAVAGGTVALLTITPRLRAGRARPPDPGAGQEGRSELARSPRQPV